MVVSKGEVGLELLGIYDDECWLFCCLIVDQVYMCYVTCVVFECGIDEVKLIVDDFMMEIGMVMRSRVVVGDGSVFDGVLHFLLVELCGQFGMCVLHVVFGCGCSMFDLFGREFVFLCFVGAVFAVMFVRMYAIDVDGFVEVYGFCVDGVMFVWFDGIVVWCALDGFVFEVFDVAFGVIFSC